MSFTNFGRNIFYSVLWCCAFFLMSSVCGSWAFARDFYVDPVKGSKTNDGSAAKPWRSLQEVLNDKKIETRDWPKLPYKSGMKLVLKNAGAPVKGGDTIWLRSGYYGELVLQGHHNAKMLTVAAQAGHTPKFRNIVVKGSANWHFRGLQVSPSFDKKYARVTLVKIESGGYRGPTENITFEKGSLFSVPNITAWSAKDWNDKSCSAFLIYGKKITIRNNIVRNINFGVSVVATHSLIEGNTIENFAGDGIRALGDHSVFQYNTIRNCYKVNSNHDDGIQSWSVGKDKKVGTGQVTGVVLRGNTIINYTDPKQKFRCTLQGIGLFDGTFVKWVIENNVIIVDHWHGITMLGVKDSRVINNTLMDPNTSRPGPPWIMLDKHKKGMAPSGNIIRNNLTPKVTNTKNGVSASHNVIYKDAKSHFVNPAKYDLHLLPNSSAIDKGTSHLAPKLDRDKNPRPYGPGIDVGAYEWGKPKPKPEPHPAEKPKVEKPPVQEPIQDTSPNKEPVTPEPSTKPDAGGLPESVADTWTPPADKKSGADTTTPQDIAVVNDAPSSSDDSQGGADFSGNGTDSGGSEQGTEGGCACSSGVGGMNSGIFVFLLFLVFWMRRWRVARI